MNEKIKAKIEALSEELYKKHYPDHEKLKEAGLDMEFRKACIDYAVVTVLTPWAEWCERLAEELNILNTIKTAEKNQYPIEENSVLKEYIEWLNEK